MLRHSSSIQSVLVYATFFTLSLMIHMVVVWPRPAQSQEQGNSAETAPVASQALPDAEGTQTGAAGSEGTDDERSGDEVLK